MKDSLKNEITEALEGLSYQGETGAPFELIDYEQIDFDDFFNELIGQPPFQEPERQKIAEKFIHLRNLLARNFLNLTVVEFGSAEKEIYIAGTDQNNKNPFVIRTRAVEK